MKKLFFAFVITFASLLPSCAWEENKPLNVDFKQGTGLFSVKDQYIDDALLYVWQRDKNRGMVATGKKGDNKYKSESWLVSPRIDLSDCSTTTLIVSQSFSDFGGIDNAKHYTCLYVSEEGEDWKPLETFTYPQTESGEITESAVDLSEYDGKDVRFAFCYTSDEDVAGTWVIRKVSIVGIGMPVVTNFAGCRSYPDGTEMVLNLPLEDEAKILYQDAATPSRAFAYDATGGLEFYNFLGEDAGWHTPEGTGLVGSVTGVYRLVNGFPRFEVSNLSDAGNILCLDSMYAISPEIVTISSLNSANVTETGNIYTVEGTLRKEDKSSFAIVETSGTLPLSFDLSDGQKLLSGLEDGMQGKVTGILYVNGENHVLHVTAFESDELSAIRQNYNATGNVRSSYGVGGERMNDRKGIHVSTGHKWIQR